MKQKCQLKKRETEKGNTGHTYQKQDFKYTVYAWGMHLVHLLQSLFLSLVVLIFVIISMTFYISVLHSFSITTFKTPTRTGKLEDSKHVFYTPLKQVLRKTNPNSRKQEMSFSCWRDSKVSIIRSSWDEFVTITCLWTFNSGRKWKMQPV